MRIVLLLLYSLSGACFAATDTRVLRAGDSELKVEVVEVDDRVRADLLHRWVAETADAAKTVSGRFPLDYAYVRVMQIDSNDPSPVPWGQTRRRNQTGVLLYVRRDATYQALRDDWTAIHELSHLFHPYLGERGRWLAEGLASYYQNVLRARAGLLSTDEAWERLDAGFRRGERARAGTRLDAVGRQRSATMRVYWAGAAYWLEADLALRRDHDTSLDTALDAYARCCLRGNASVAPEDFVAALDRMAGSDAFSTLYARHAAAREFPSLHSTYAQLAMERNGDGLRFAGTREAARLRALVMGPSGRARDQGGGTRPE